MSIKAAFLDEIKLGTFVTIWFGSQPAVTGEVVKLTDDIVRLRCESGSPRIALESIIAYDTPEKTSASPTAVPVIENTEPAVNAPEAVEPAVEAVEQPPIPGTPSPELAKLLEVFEDCEVPSDEECADFEGTAADLRDCEDVSLRSAADGIASSFTALRRQNPDNTDMHNIRAKTLKLILDYPDYSELLYCLLGSMYYLLGEYESSCAYFSRGGDLLGAIYSALHTKDEKALADALCEYTALPELPEPFALKLYAEHAVKTKKLGALKYHLNSIRYSGGELDDEAELLIATAALITNLAALSEDWIAELKSSKLAALDAFFAALPEGWSADISEVSLDCDFDELHVDPARSVGEIVKYSDQKHCGFIGEDGNDCFFYFGQIPEEEPLREMLDAGYWQKLEVSYLYGVNHTNHSRAAYDVRLTPRMSAELESRRAELKELDVTLTGYIESGEFNCRSGFGRITCGDKHYSVRRAEIIDPFLWASMTGNIKFSLKVEFRPIRLKDRYGAVDVRSAEPIELSEYDLNSAITNGEITRASVDGWADRKAKLTQPANPDEERKIKYVALTPWSERDKVVNSFVKKQPSFAPKTAPGRIYPNASKPGEPAKPTTAPTVEVKPVVEPVPAAEEKPVVEAAPAVEEKTVVEPVPAVEEKTVVEPVPAVEEKPVVEPAPAVEEKSVVEAAPAAEEKPAVEAAPVVEEKSAPAVESASEAEAVAECDDLPWADTEAADEK